MNYIINQLSKITPTFIEVDGPHGLVNRLNPGPERQTPPGGIRCVYSDLTGLYGDDPAKRIELWEASSGSDSDVDIFAACAGLRDWQAGLIRAGGNTRLLAIANPYQPAERETWAVQMTEAEAWLADNNNTTPMIDAICAGRGIDKPTLVGYIMANTNLFRQASGGILGIQQALLMEIYTAPTVDALLAVEWP
jgi:hypothetical protein